MEDFPELKMTALGILYQVRWSSRNHKSADFLLKEKLAGFISSLEDDDIGYFYDPSYPDRVCLHPGELCGYVSNANLPYSFNIYKGLSSLAKFLNDLEDDYNGVGIFIVDEEVSLFESYASKLEKNIKMFVFEIGKCSLKEVSEKLGFYYYSVKDVADLDFEVIRKVLSLVR